MRGLRLGLGLANVAASGGGGSPATQWNAATSNAGYTISGTGNTVATVASGSGDIMAKANNGNSGAVDKTVTFVLGGSGAWFVGLANASQVNTDYVGSSTNSIGLFFSGDVRINGSSVGTASASYANGGVIAFRYRNGKVYILYNGTKVLGDGDAQTGGIDISTMGTVYPAASANAASVGRSFTVDGSTW